MNQRPHTHKTTRFRLCWCLALVALALPWPLASAAETISGQVVGVSDGDTITVLDAGKKQTRVRLAQIDAPEKRQDFGVASKDALSGLVYGKPVTVEVETTDRYGRTVGKVLVGGIDANLEQVKKGMAWVYRQYAKDQTYFAAEGAAKAAKLGLWSRPDAVPPWEFRHGKAASTGQTDKVSASSTPSRPVAIGTAATGSCGTKRTCGQMASCEEARHYLNDCGLQKLDRDGDGVPCESVCR
jgi:endonuclease YncB( thermonuclease family)